MAFLIGLIPFLDVKTWSSCVSCAISYMSPRLLASVIFS